MLETSSWGRLLKFPGFELLAILNNCWVKDYEQELDQDVIDIFIPWPAVFFQFKRPAASAGISSYHRNLQMMKTVIADNVSWLLRDNPWKMVALHRFYKYFCGYGVCRDSRQCQPIDRSIDPLLMNNQLYVSDRSITYRREYIGHPKVVMTLRDIQKTSTFAQHHYPLWYSSSNPKQCLKRSES